MILVKPVMLDSIHVRKVQEPLGEERLNSETLMELAVNNSNNQKNQDRDDRNSNHPIRSHPIKQLASDTCSLIISKMGYRRTVPTGHAPQSLNTRVHISLALVQVVSCMLDSLPLHIQICKDVAPHILGLQCCPLTLLQTCGAALQPLCAGQELLALLEVLILGFVGVSVTEKGFAVVREGL